MISNRTAAYSLRYNVHIFTYMYNYKNSKTRYVQRKLKNPQINYIYFFTEIISIGFVAKIRLWNIKYNWISMLYIYIIYIHKPKFIGIVKILTQCITNTYFQHWQLGCNSTFYPIKDLIINLSLSLGQLSQKTYKVRFPGFKRFYFNC